MKKIVLSIILSSILFFLLTISTSFCAIKKPIVKKKSTIEILLTQAYQAQQAEKYREAIKVYKKIIERGAKISQVYTNLGFCFKKVGEYQQAIKNYKNAIKVDPKSTKPYMALGKLYLKTAKFDKAKIIQKKLKKIHPGEADKLLKKIKSHEKNN